MKGGLLFSLLVQKISLDIEDIFLQSCFILDHLKTVSVSNSFTNKTYSMPVVTHRRNYFIDFPFAWPLPNKSSWPI